MNLLVRSLMSKVEQVAHEKGFEHARVLSKVNARGELVIAILIPPRTSAEWDEADPTREQRRESRERR